MNVLLEYMIVKRKLQYSYASVLPIHFLSTVYWDFSNIITIIKMIGPDKKDFRLLER